MSRRDHHQHAEYTGRNTEHGHSRKKRSFGCLSILAIMLLTVLVTVGGTLWAINSQLFAKKFKPVALNNSEAQELALKLNEIGIGDSTSSLDRDTENPVGRSKIEFSENPAAKNDDMAPEQYAEDDSKRRIELTERELNALLAKNTDLAERLVVDLSNDTASAKLLINLDPDFPFFGGKTLKMSSGADLSYIGGRPSVVLKGVSVWGIPIPNAWLGGLKNIDLVREFGGSDGFWKSFADGIEDVRVEDGKLLIQLAE